MDIRHVYCFVLYIIMYIVCLLNSCQQLLKMLTYVVIVLNQKVTILHIWYSHNTKNS